MTRADKKEIDKAIKALKQFLLVCEETKIKCEFRDDTSQRIDLYLLERKIERRIDLLKNLKKYC